MDPTLVVCNIVVVVIYVDLIWTLYIVQGKFKGRAQTSK
jgi:hypothetical protein